MTKFTDLLDDYLEAKENAVLPSPISLTAFTKYVERRQKRIEETKKALNDFIDRMMAPTPLIGSPIQEIIDEEWNLENHRNE